MGGTAREWITTLSDDLEPGGAVQLHLTMTKHEAPDVSIGWELVLE